MVLNKGIQIEGPGSEPWLVSLLCIQVHQNNTRLIQMYNKDILTKNRFVNNLQSQVTNFCLWATGKTYFFIPASVLGTEDLMVRNIWSLHNIS